MQDAGLQEFAEKLEELGVQKVNDLHELEQQEGVASKIEDIKSDFVVLKSF